MGRANGDEDAGFTDIEMPETMNDDDAMNEELPVNIGGNFAHFG